MSNTTKAVLTPEDLAEIKARAGELYPIPFTNRVVTESEDAQGKRQAHILCATEERLKAKERDDEAKAAFVKSIQSWVKKVDSLQEEVTRLKAQFKPVQLCPKCNGLGAIQGNGSSVFQPCPICNGAKIV